MKEKTTMIIKSLIVYNPPIILPTKKSITMYDNIKEEEGRRRKKVEVR